MSKDNIQFRPVGGFPSIVRIDDTKKIPDIRSFSPPNIVSIQEILKKKNKNPFFSGSEELGIRSYQDADSEIEDNDWAGY